MSIVDTQREMSDGSGRRLLATVASVAGGLGIVVNDETPVSLEELRRQIAERLRFLFDHEFHRIPDMLYRLDVDESRADAIFAGSSVEQIPEALADLIVERSLQRLESRRHFRPDRNAAGSATTSFPFATIPSMKRIPLLKLAHARSGDKGDAGNVGVIARRPEYYPVIARALTAERVKAHFDGICHGPVERFELPNLWALNFLLHNTLGGGGTVSLKLDAQGKTLSSAMLRMDIEVPDDLVVDTVGGEALAFFLDEGVLTFGEFTLKSGRKSPYFFNTGSLSSGRQLARLGALYGALLRQTIDFDEATVVFGSAYKGIPIAVATAIALSSTGRPVIRAVSDRKEAKTHGDAGAFVGIVQAGDRAVIVDDVITTGGTKLEAIERLRAVGCDPLGLIIAFDRAEPVEPGGRTAREVFEAETGLRVYALASVSEIAAVRPEWGEKIDAYLQTITH